MAATEVQLYKDGRPESPFLQAMAERRQAWCKQMENWKSGESGMSMKCPPPIAMLFRGLINWIQPGAVTRVCPLGGQLASKSTTEANDDCDDDETAEIRSNIPPIVTIVRNVFPRVMKSLIGGLRDRKTWSVIGFSLIVAAYEGIASAGVNGMQIKESCSVNGKPEPKSLGRPELKALPAPRESEPTSPMADSKPRTPAADDNDLDSTIEDEHLPEAPEGMQWQRTWTLVSNEPEKVPRSFTEFDIEPALLDDREVQPALSRNVERQVMRLFRTRGLVSDDIRSCAVARLSGASRSSYTGTARAVVFAVDVSETFKLRVESESEFAQLVDQAQEDAQQLVDRCFPAYCVERFAAPQGVKQTRLLVRFRVSRD